MNANLLEYPKILLVDDDDNVRRFLKKYLTKEYKSLTKGVINVSDANNGVTALEVLNHHKIDILLTDLKMPQMDGISLFQKVKKIEDLKVIFLTGTSDESQIIQFMNDGAFGYIKKPIDIDLLFELIKKAFDKLLANQPLFCDHVKLNHINNSHNCI